MKLVILAGGYGSRLGEIANIIPKPMVEIGGKPILWHIMKIYSHYGIKEFVICLGYKAHIIKEYFLHYRERSSDFTIRFEDDSIEFHNNHDEKEWKITLVDTGLDSLKGSRLKKIEKFLVDDINLLTYGDGVANIDINHLIDFHLRMDKMVTISGVHPPARFGELQSEKGILTSFKEKAQTSQGLINGGYMVFNKKLLEYLTEDEECDLEYGIFERLAEEGRISVYKHEGLWACVDNQRDLAKLKKCGKIIKLFGRYGKIMHGFNNIYRGKTVLVTGHTGFKGSWLSIWLMELGAKVIGYGLDPLGAKDNFVLAELKDKLVDVRGDIRDFKKLKNTFDKYKPDYVFHLAAQSLVKQSYEQPVYTYEVNLIGTINVLECVKNTESVKVGIFITTDKCYENKEQVWGYKETDSLGGYDPYSSSKGACEIAIHSWRESFMNLNQYSEHGKAIASVRAGNVIGGGDWASNRIIPDCIRALECKQPIEIRNPYAIRPWQHVLEPLSGYLILGHKLTENPMKYSGAWNFGPMLNSVVTVWEVGCELVKQYGSGQLKDVSLKKGVHEAKFLNLDISKAKFQLGWTPKLKLEKAIQYTVEWYKRYKQEDVYYLCVEQIGEFMN